MGIVCFFKPLKGFLLFAESSVDESDFVSTNAVFAHVFSQLHNCLAGFGRLACPGIGVAQMAK